MKRTLVGRQRQAVRKRVASEQEFHCAQCSVDIGAQPYELDHIVSLIHGGTNERDNLQALCIPCHKLKTAQIKGKRSRINPLTGYPIETTEERSLKTGGDTEGGAFAFTKFT